MTKALGYFMNQALVRGWIRWREARALRASAMQKAVCYLINHTLAWGWIRWLLPVQAIQNLQLYEQLRPGPASRHCKWLFQEPHARI